MRKPSRKLSIEQKLLLYYRDHPGASLGECAKQLGIGIKSLIKAAESLYKKGLVQYTGEKQERNGKKG